MLACVDCFVLSTPWKGPWGLSDDSSKEMRAVMSANVMQRHQYFNLAKTGNECEIQMFWENKSWASNTPSRLVDFSCLYMALQASSKCSLFAGLHIFNSSSQS